jgi:acyl-CoA synthetase (AMP-forming)/AMP-acid ligase II
MYRLLRRLNFNPATRSTLRTMTQAGGGMKPELISFYYRTALHNKKRLYVMYGQTEATARISYMPPQRLGDKIGAVGIPIPGGALRLEPVDELSGAEQLVYEGPNVMLGYANEPDDLALGDVQRGILRTADLGRMDADGYFYVLGRLKRIAKVFGKRINLADVENEAERRFPCRAAAVDRDDKIGLLVEPLAPLDLRDVRLYLARFLSVRPHVIRVELIDQIPMTASGKKDYHAMGSPRYLGSVTK